jgi:hypothetical protein
MGAANYYPRNEAAGVGVTENSPQSNAEVKYAWRFATNPHTHLHGIHRVITFLIHLTVLLSSAILMIGDWCIAVLLFFCYVTERMTFRNSVKINVTEWLCKRTRGKTCGEAKLADFCVA